MLFAGFDVRERRERSRASLEAVGLSERATHRPDQLSVASRQVLAAEQSYALASISLWEVSMLFAKGRLTTSVSLEKWFASSLPKNLAITLEITPAIAIDANHLPGQFHGDPADRLIVATARQYGLTLTTSDQEILDYPHVKSLSTR